MFFTEKKKKRAKAVKALKTYLVERLKDGVYDDILEDAVKYCVEAALWKGTRVHLRFDMEIGQPAIYMIDALLED